MTTLTEEEIAKCEERLKDRRFCDRVIKFLKHLFGRFEEYRLITENRFIRYVYQRPEIKSLESVVNKINRKRKTDSSYDFDSIEDLAGIKVVCPYKSSAIETMEWMFRQPTFDLQPKSIDDAWEETQTGYRGWHFIAKPSRQLIRIMPIYIEARCEIQVKTMLQEAWDAQTHDVSYKHEEQIDNQLLKQLKTQSDIYFHLDQQSETLRELIKGTEGKEREHKKAAAASYLYYTILSGILEQASQKCHVNLKIENFPLTIQDLSKVNKFIEHYARIKGVDKDLIRFLGYIALNQGDAVQEETAITLSQDYLSKNASDPFAEDVVAGLYWALSRLDSAITHEGKAIEKAKIAGTVPDILLDNYCYWLTEAVLFGKYEKETSINKIFNCNDRLYQKHLNDPKFLDTAAFVKITLGRTYDEIKEGVTLLEQLKDIAFRQPEGNLKTMIMSFYNHHHKIANSRLSSINFKF